MKLKLNQLLREVVEVDGSYLHTYANEPPVFRILDVLQCIYYTRTPCNSMKSQNKLTRSLAKSSKPAEFAQRAAKA